MALDLLLWASIHFDSCLGCRPLPKGLRLFVFNAHDHNANLLLCNDLWFTGDFEFEGVVFG